MDQLLFKTISGEDMRVLFRNEVPANFWDKKSKRKTKLNNTLIIDRHPLNYQEQHWSLHIKMDRLAKCASYPCRKVIAVGTNCFRVEGALTVRYNETNASPKILFLC